MQKGLEEVIGLAKRFEVGRPQLMVVHRQLPKVFLQRLRREKQSHLLKGDHGRSGAGLLDPHNDLN